MAVDDPHSRPNRTADPHATDDDSGIDLDRAWSLNPKVALRPESFGALAYDFGTRRLSFLKSRRLVDVVEQLAAAPSGRSALAAVGIEENEFHAYRRALRTLAESGMIIERPRS
jgi:putative mycofactocin binding protein MftB